MPYVSIRVRNRRLAVPLAPTAGWPGWLLVILANALWVGITLLFLFA